MHDVLVIGGGQSGLAVAYYLRRTGLSWTILDAQPEPGGAWQQGWDSLRLFSPARFSSLPGRLMEGGSESYPSRDDALAYLRAYESHYDLPVERPVRVRAVRKHAATGDFLVDADGGMRRARAVVSATGTWEHPVVPDIPGHRAFGGVQIHSATYRSPDPFRGKRVLVVGGGNSGAQILAELAPVAKATWVTLEPPVFLPDSVDGRYLFEQATLRYRAKEEGRPPPPPANLGDVVMVPTVKAARARGDLEAVRPFVRFTPAGVAWPDGREESVDAVIWCTGFRPALEHLRPLGVIEADGRVKTRGTRSVVEPGLWLVGYGNWTGFASATLIGVGRSARATVDEVVRSVEAGSAPSEG
ncbi:MAG: NAD(P)/FAD-dependent oxidoreductase [Gemmatimonadales bacterium]|nr:MAG: NAD(P)/FAD-dependent oxidoreductase [Gemmatimonadales bacterium]